MQVGARMIGAAIVMLVGVVLMAVGFPARPGLLLVAGVSVTGIGVVWGIVNLIGDATKRPGTAW